MKTWTETLTLAALAVLFTLAACEPGENGTSPESDVVGELIEVALKAHEEATGATRPERIYLGGGALDVETMPPEIGEAVLARTEYGAPDDGRTLVFDALVADEVGVGIMEYGANQGPVYFVTVKRSSTGVEIGEMVATGRMDIR